MKYLIITLLFCLTTNAYVPTLDSLLRNGNNVDVANNTIIVNLKIQSEKTNEKSFRLQVFNEREDYPKLVQLQYDQGKFSSKYLYDIKVVPFHSLDALSKNKEKIEQRFFFAIMRMLMTNSGDLLIELFREHGINVPTNQQLINKDKLNLLNDYKRYLAKVKSDSSLRDELNNPMQPKDSEQEQKVDEIMAEPFLKSDGLVKRVKSGDFFNWVVHTENLFIRFDNTHRITDLSLKTSAGELKASFGRFVLVGGSIEFPESIEFSLPNGETYFVKSYKGMIISDNSKKFYRRL
ncbi:MAG: hypothetical protein CME62_16965 [Halobacteriovoraceae bacterium]|nr:hypothetical protein [Halobacteriovoraceae bacterium]